MNCQAPIGGDGVPLAMTNPLSALVQRQTAELENLRLRLHYLEQSAGEPLTLAAIDMWEADVIEQGMKERAPAWVDGAFQKAARLMRGGVGAFLALQAVHAIEKGEPPRARSSEALPWIVWLPVAVIGAMLVLDVIEFVRRIA